MLLFQNNGVLPIEGFTTFGMSAKPGSTNPIGKFGTGLKNAVAIILRLGGSITVWRGDTEYVFYTKDEEFRGQTFKRIRMKKRTGLLSRWKYEVLPFTTELGKHWEPWMAYRELEANTLDEEAGRSSIIDDETPEGMSFLNSFEGRPGTTTILVDCREVEEAHVNRDKTFLPDDRVPIYEDARVKVYPGASDYIFYRGMRVTDLRKPTMFTYELSSVVLTEDRTSMYTFLDNDNMKKSLLECDVPEIVDQVVRKADGFHEGTFNWDEKKPSVSPAWRTSLSRSGLSPRFATLRDNLSYGLGSREDVEITMEVRMWEVVLGAVKDIDESVHIQITEQLEEAGWIDTRTPRPSDEIAQAALVEELIEEGGDDVEFPF